jgi:hypothetical protein
MCERSFYRTVVKDCKEKMLSTSTSPHLPLLVSHLCPAQSSVLLPLHGAAIPAGCGPACVHTPSILLNRSITCRTLSSLVQCISRQHGSVPSLGFVVKGYHARSTTSLMRHRTLVRELTLSSVCFTFFWQTMAWEKCNYNCTVYMHCTGAYHIRTVI